MKNVFNVDVKSILIKLEKNYLTDNEKDIGIKKK
jgi:hypothetical protein